MNLNCAPEIKGRLVSRDLLSTEVRIIHTPWPNVVWKLLFQLRSQVSLNFSGSKYLFFVTSHSDLPVSPCLFLFTSLLHLVHQHCKTSTEKLAILSRSGYKHNNYFYINICLSLSRSFEGMRWLKLWRSHIWGLVKNFLVTLVVGGDAVS